MLTLLVVVKKVLHVEVQMGSGEEQQMPAAAEATSPANFLANLGKALREKENVDTGLANILAQHLLTATPAIDAVAKARTTS